MEARKGGTGTMCEGGEYEFGSLKKKKTGEAPAQIWIVWKMDRSGGSCGSGISEPIGRVYLMEAIMGGTGTILD